MVFAHINKKYLMNEKSTSRKTQINKLYLTIFYENKMQHNLRFLSKILGNNIYENGDLYLTKNKSPNLLIIIVFPSKVENWFNTDFGLITRFLGEIWYPQKPCWIESTVIYYWIICPNAHAICLKSSLHPVCVNLYHSWHTTRKCTKVAGSFQTYHYCI